jgi:hypothetical protein
VPTPHLKIAPADSVTWVELAKVDGDSGTLTAIGVAGGPDYHYFQIEIDDVIVADDYLAGTAVGGHANNGIGVALPFSAKLIVRVKDAPAGRAITRFWAAYVTANSKPTTESTYIEKLGKKEYRHQRLVYRKPDGTEYVTESLIGPRRIARVHIDRDSVQLMNWTRDEGGYVPLSGEVVLIDTETGGEERPDHVDVVIGLAGRQEVLSEAQLGPSSRRDPEGVWLPAPGEYSIATTLDDHSNVPAFFTAL